MTDHVAFQMEFAGNSDVGRARQRNEDNYAINKEAGLALVCDGMGGHASGDVASRIACETIVDFIFEYEPDLAADVDDDEEDEDRTVTSRDEHDELESHNGTVATTDPAIGRSIATIRAAVQLANRRLIALNRERGYPDGRGMGTTTVGLWQISDTDKVIIFHAGDSRLYRLRNDELRQLTRDHSLYQAWLDGGGQGHPPHRNIIVRALGTMQDVEPEVSLQAVLPDDLFLICSDGLSSMVADPEIGEILRTDKSSGLLAVCTKLIELANARGGHDNITIVLAHARPRA